MPWFTKKERRMQFSALTAIIKADFGRFRPVPAVFRPISAVSAADTADTTRYGRYGPILAESARFGTNRAASARIEPSRRESEKKKKKKNADAVRRTGNRVGRGCGTSGAASVLSSLSSSLSKLFISQSHHTFKLSLFLLELVNQLNNTHSP